MISRRGRFGLASVVAALALVGPPAGASAHAMLEGTVPERGAVLKTQPKQVIFRYSESVEGNRTRLLAAMLMRFSPIALGCVAVLLVTGTIQAIEHIDTWGQLTATGFGRAVVIKVALILVLIAIGVVNRRRVIPTLRGLVTADESPGGAGHLLRRTLRAEVALVLVVLGVTAALVSYAPPDALAAGPFDGTTALGPLRLEATMDPARVGPNELHLYLLKASNGTPFDATKQLTVTLSLPSKGIGPLPATAHAAGPGHYAVDGVQLIPGGAWQLHVTARVSDFDEYDATLKVPVR